MTLSKTHRRKTRDELEASGWFLNNDEDELVRYDYPGGSGPRAFAHPTDPFDVFEAWLDRCHPVGDTSRQWWIENCLVKVLTFPSDDSLGLPGIQAAVTSKECKCDLWKGCTCGAIMPYQSR